MGMNVRKLFFAEAATATTTATATATATTATTALVIDPVISRGSTEFAKNRRAPSPRGMRRRRRVRTRGVALSFVFLSGFVLHDVYLYMYLYTRAHSCGIKNKRAAAAIEGPRTPWTRGVRGHVRVAVAVAFENTGGGVAAPSSTIEAIGSRSHGSPSTDQWRPPIPVGHGRRPIRCRHSHRLSMP